MEEEEEEEEEEEGPPGRKGRPSGGPPVDPSASLTLGSGQLAYSLATLTDVRVHMTDCHGSQSTSQNVVLTSPRPTTLMRTLFIYPSERVQRRCGRP